MAVQDTPESAAGSRRIPGSAVKSILPQLELVPVILVRAAGTLPESLSYCWAAARMVLVCDGPVTPAR